MAGNHDEKLKVFAHKWLNKPIPSDVIKDMCNVLEDSLYPPEKRVHQIVWIAVKWGMESSALANSTKSK